MKERNDKEYFLGFSQGYEKGWQDHEEDVRDALKGKLIVNKDDISPNPIIYCTRAEKVFGRIEAISIMIICVLIFVKTIELASKSGFNLFAEFVSFVGIIVGLFLYCINERREEVDDDEEENVY